MPGQAEALVEGRDPDDGRYGHEQLVGQEPVGRRKTLDHGRLHEVAMRVRPRCQATATDDHPPAVSPCFRDGFLEASDGPRVDGTVPHPAVQWIAGHEGRRSLCQLVLAEQALQHLQSEQQQQW